MTTDQNTAPLDLDGLERLAKAATPGPWEQYAHGTEVYGTGATGGCFITNVQSRKGAPDAAYIAAANPATILALISQAREAERMRALAKDLCFIARTSGGTAGPDPILMAACAAVEEALGGAS